jgi:hypothetical protein
LAARLEDVDSKVELYLPLAIDELDEDLKGGIGVGVLGAVVTGARCV